MILGLAFHLAAVGLIDLSVIIIATSFTGVIEVHSLGKVFEEVLSFTAFLSVFFSIIAVIIDQQLFKPVIDTVLHVEDKGAQLALLYIANELLSMVSDNVFVGTPKRLSRVSIFANISNRSFNPNFIWTHGHHGTALYCSPNNSWPCRSYFATFDYFSEASALFFQYIMQLSPCVMCIYERVAMLAGLR